MKKFILPSLIAAGFALNVNAQNNDNQFIDEDISLKNNIKGIDSIVNRDLPFTLMAHTSHRSHGSHSSHASHSSSSHYSSSHSSHSSHYSHYSYGSGLNYDDQYRDQGLGRNFNSTPSESILPRSPAIVSDNKINSGEMNMGEMNSTKKEKIVGTSKKFIILTQRAQLALYGMGYYSGAISGSINSELVASITKFQNKYNLKVTGSLSDELITYLNIGEGI